MKIIITGASGFVGSKVSEIISKKNFNIYLSYNKKKIKSKNINFFKLDLNKKINMLKFFKNTDLLIHLAWQDLDNFNNPVHLKKHLKKHKSFLEMMINNGLKNLVVTGTCFEYGKINGKLNENSKTFPVTNYAKAKNNLRKFLFRIKKKYNFNLTWIRLFYIYGINKKRETLTNLLINSSKSGKTLILNKEIKRDFLDVETVAKLIINLSLRKKDMGIVNLSSGRAINMKQFVNIIKSKFKISPVVKFMNSKVKKYEPKIFFGDTKKIKKILGYNYKI
jgi:dTDP-6-deoxy-L-talose 4-dehydrogenase (NAD+)